MENICLFMHFCISNLESKRQREKKAAAVSFSKQGSQEVIRETASQQSLPLRNIKCFFFYFLFILREVLVTCMCMLSVYGALSIILSMQGIKVTSSKIGLISAWGKISTFVPHHSGRKLICLWIVTKYKPEYKHHFLIEN